ncbi:hypothetical protein FOFC_01502, partial [Fusarium oxysporum]
MFNIKQNHYEWTDGVDIKMQGLRFPSEYIGWNGRRVISVATLPVLLHAVEAAVVYIELEFSACPISRHKNNATNHNKAMAALSISCYV